MSIRQTIQRLRADERGLSAWLVMASVAAFMLVAVGISSALIGGVFGNAALKVNTALGEVVTTAARDTASLGYTAVEALPASSQVELEVGQHTIQAQRTITLNAVYRTAKVTVTAPRFADNGFGDLASCTTAPKTCFIAVEAVNGIGG